MKSPVMDTIEKNKWNFWEEIHTGRKKTDTKIVDMIIKSEGKFKDPYTMIDLPGPAQERSWNTWSRLSEDMRYIAAENNRVHFERMIENNNKLKDKNKIEIVYGDFFDILKSDTIKTQPLKIIKFCGVQTLGMYHRSGRHGDRITTNLVNSIAEAAKEEKVASTYWVILTSARRNSPIHPEKVLEAIVNMARAKGLFMYHFDVVEHGSPRTGEANMRTDIFKGLL